MIKRCDNPSNKYYKNYGGRGIFVCEEWHSLDNFASWALSNGYSEDLTLDRINNDDGYYPENCRWATKKEQENNKRTNRHITIDGETKTVAQWCEIYGISQQTVHSRLTNGWNEQDAIRIPPLRKTDKKYKYLRQSKAGR